MEKEIRSTLVCTSIKSKAVAALLAVVAAVALPQVLHLLGLATGTGTALGETFLPMHIAIFMVGFLAGPWAGALSGALSPVLSFALTGMPTAAMLPFMTIELAVYGLTTGLLADKKMPTIAKLFIAQVAGRAVRAVAILLGFYFMGSVIAPTVILTSIRVGLPGLVLQWIIIPLLVYYIDRKVKND